MNTFLEDFLKFVGFTIILALIFLLLAAISINLNHLLCLLLIYVVVFATLFLLKRKV